MSGTTLSTSSKDEYEYYGESKYHFFTLGKQFTILRKYCHTWLQNYSANIVKTSLKPIETAYKGFFNGSCGLPKFHGKYTHKPSFPINYITAKIQGKHIYIQRIGWMKFKGGDRYKGERFVSGQVKYECGNWYAYIVYEVEVSDKPYLLTEVGIDRNCGQVALSDGTIHHQPDLEKKEAKRRRYQRIVARREKGSNRRKLARHRLNKAWQSERNAKASWCHQTSKLIADQYDLVYMENLNIAGLTKSAKGTIEPSFVAMATNDVTSWRTLIWVCRSDKLRLVLNGGHSKNRPIRPCLPPFKGREYHFFNSPVNAALNILAVGNTATGRGGGGVARPMKRQKNEIAKRGNQFVKLSI